MEEDEKILNSILQSVYDLRERGWLHAHKIKNNSKEPVTTRQVKHYLEILTDRQLLKKQTETNYLPDPFTKKKEKITSVSYRITDFGIKYVESGFKALKNIAANKIQIFNNPNAQIMVASPGGTQIVISGEINRLLNELRDKIAELKDPEAIQEAGELTDLVEEEIKKENPRPGILKRALNGIKEYKELIPPATELLTELIK